MFKMLCRLWRFILKVFRMVLDAVIEVLGAVLKALVSLGNEVWGSIKSGGIGGIIGIALGGLALWYLWGLYSDDREKRAEREHAIELAKISNSGEYYG